MKNSLYLILGVVLLAAACTTDTAKNKMIAKGEEGPLVERYMKEMIANPTAQDHIDRNLIVNLLIDSLWDFQRTASGIYYQIDPPGKGAHPDLNSEIRCHYRGTLLNGKEFDSSYKRRKPLEFTLGKVIAGWQEVIPMLKQGGKGTFIVPSKLAYGAMSHPGGVIKPNSVLIFEIELLSFYNPPPIE